MRLSCIAHGFLSRTSPPRRRPRRPTKDPGRRDPVDQDVLRRLQRQCCSGAAPRQPPTAAAPAASGEARRARPVPAVLQAREPHPEVRPLAPAGVLEARVAARPPMAAADRPLGTAVFLPVPAACLSAAAAEPSGGAVAPVRADRRRQGNQPEPAVMPVPPVARQGQASGARLEGAVNWERGSMPEPAAPAAAVRPGRAAHQAPVRRGLPGPAVSSTPQTALEAQATVTRINCGSMEDPDP